MVQDNFCEFDEKIYVAHIYLQSEKKDYEEWEFINADVRFSTTEH